MEGTFPKPKIFVSKCLGFAACRWNGAVIPDKFIEKLNQHAHFTTVCPEIAIGLGVPRDPLRIVSVNDEQRLLQPNTGKDVSIQMETFAKEYLASLKEIDGFILKDRSPSCGVKGVKVYIGKEDRGTVSTAAGFFGRSVLQRFGHVPIETEGRLMDYTLREHFLTQIFTFARFRTVGKQIA